VNAVNRVNTPQRSTIATISSKESAETKGRRYLTEGRLRVLLVKGSRIYAECRGSGHDWHPCFVGGKWGCDCEARGRCSHLIALQLVTTAPTAGDAA
jgi:hypothetical protein